ncbi:ABC transporter transmembrane region domain-containing protein [Ditylenchus destructor]|uniref:ABC transporter transmembrane region domain-containing protein n=1 Tax=Ditylenchus destructor TaxID=166010 RepID=A0AAD4NEL3_9BILA|nr:ABC transporter transmembrane region domain-containing protein [Ditylenchus destructor]
MPTEESMDTYPTREAGNCKSRPPLLSTVQGDVAQAFTKANALYNQNATIDDIDADRQLSYSWDEFNSDIVRCCLFYLGIGIIIFSTACTQVMCFLKSGENVVRRLRMELFAAILRQDIAWFDEHSSGQVSSRMFDNLERVREGTGDKVALFLQCIVQFLAGYGIAFYYDWKMTLIMASLSPLMIITGAFMARLLGASVRAESLNYAAAGAIAEQALSSIRTVVAFNGQEHECSRYDKALNDGKRNGIRRAFYTGVGLGVTFVVLYGAYSLAFWLGTTFIADGRLTVKTVITVFFGVLVGSTALGHAGQHFAVIAIAQGAVVDVYEIIDRAPKNDQRLSKEGIRPPITSAHIRIQNLKFFYPSRPDVTILNKFSMDVKPGETVALVGSSGSGKSTIVQLLLRHYDPIEGNISVDNYDIHALDLQHWRNQIGVVNQEPVLFDCSIEENIRLGNEEATYDQIWDALRMANAEHFVNKLPEGINTLVGERGIQMSGGQKQRIAIARALVRNPKILLLDEATSALDAHAEAKVQAALDKATKGRTTLIIAHRLSTVRHVDRILAMDSSGTIVEQGTHMELMERKGLYYELVNAQQMMSASDEQKKAEESLVGADDDDTIPQRRTSKSRAIRRASSNSNYYISNLPRRISSTSSTHSNACAIEEYNDSPISADHDPLLGKLAQNPLQDITEEGSVSDSDTETNETESGRQTQKMRLKKELAKEGAVEQNIVEIIKQARPEWPFLSIAIASAIVRGIVYPTFAVLFTKMLRIFSLTNVEEMRHQGHMWSLLFLALGSSQAILLFSECVIFGSCAERLTMRLRSKLFRNIMRMDITYFDSPRHATGKLTTRLATDTPNVKSAIDFRLAAVFSAAVAFCGGIALAFYYCWQLALIVIWIFPLAGLGQMFHVGHLRGRALKDKWAYEQAGKLMLESMDNIRTVHALSAERKFMDKFGECLDNAHKRSTKSSFSQSLSFAFAVSIPQFIHAVVFYTGLFFIRGSMVEPMGVFNVMFAISFTSTTIGFASSYFPEYAKAKVAAGIIFKMLSECPQIDSLSKGGTFKSITGAIHFRSVHFAYPQRIRARILSGLDLQVKAGERLALVGASGCGKSTIISLLERFYDPSAGSVLIDDEDIRQHNVGHLRSQLALVSQEPTLFDCSIRENLLYGLDASQVSDEKLRSALKLANLDNFIDEQLPEGWHTRVGEKGVQLSGGQKQRLAIARAILRDPKILLLDEATSALDTESEKMVQTALERVSEGRTCIVIAHRLSTIAKVDQIVVLQDGVAVEKGTHQELISRCGLYFELCQKANLTKEERNEIIGSEL